MLVFPHQNQVVGVPGSERAIATFRNLLDDPIVWRLEHRVLENVLVDTGQEFLVIVHV